MGSSHTPYTHTFIRGEYGSTGGGYSCHDNPTCGQLNRNLFHVVPVHACDFLASRDGFGLPAPRQSAHRINPLILHTILGLNLVLTRGICPAFPETVSIIYILVINIGSTAIGSVPSSSGHAMSYRWRSLRRDHRRRASINPHGISNQRNGCSLIFQVSPWMNEMLCASLFSRQSTIYIIYS